MAKQDLIRTQGKVTEVLPNATFRVTLIIDDADGPEILCHISGKMRKNKINILKDDAVEVEMSPYDMEKGRIIYRYKS